MAAVVTHIRAAILTDRELSGAPLLWSHHSSPTAASRSRHNRHVGIDALDVAKRTECVFECQQLKSFESSGEDFPEHHEVTHQ